MNTLMKPGLILATLFLLTACAQSSVREPASPFYRVPVGSQLTLNQPLEIRPGHTRVFVQRGVVTGFSDLDQYWPSCSFEVRELRQEPQEIASDNFSVVNVQWGETQIVGLPHLKIAGLNLPSFAAFEMGEPLVARYYDLWLSSEQQPNVMRLRCFGSMADQSEADLPLYIEIEAALGAVATIDP